jgi:hypothetical protein
MARKPKDLTVLHGHRVITGPELRATFVAKTRLGEVSREASRRKR